MAVGRAHAKVHVPTNNPEDVMAKLFRFGTISGQKGDDMRIQYADAHDRRASVAIVTDSSCDLSSAGLGRTAESKTAFPRTAQPPAHFFSRLYAYLGDYYDQVLAIHLSAAMSGTCDTSQRKAKKTDGRTTVFDSRHLSGSLALVVLRAAEAAEAAGKSIRYGKSFSERANQKTIIRMTTEIHRQNPLRWYAIGHAAAPEKAAAMAAELQKALGFTPLYVTDISAVVALNSGPGAVSVVTMSE